MWGIVPSTQIFGEFLHSLGRLLPHAAQQPALPLSAHKQPSMGSFSTFQNRRPLLREQQTKNLINYGAASRQKTARSSNRLDM
jgi:hypothetical protein